jgi:hypothetical protein
MIVEDNMLIKQVSPSQQQVEESIYLLDKDLTAELKQIAAVNEKRASYLSDKAGPFLSRQDFPVDNVTATIKDIQNYATDDFARQRSSLNDYVKATEQITLFNAHVGQRPTVTGPPYDVEWTTGSFAYAHKDTGEFGIATMDGYAAAAVGIYITSGENTLGQISPFVPVNYSWINVVVNGGWASCNGGVGVLIYDLTNTTAVPLPYKATLWNRAQNGTGLINGPDSTTYIGSVINGEMLFPLYANRLYLAWVWCWGWSGSSDSGRTTAALGSISCKMPFAVVRPRHL